MERFGSVSSIYSSSGVKGDYSITGEVRLKLQQKGNELLIYVDRARELAAADSNGFSDPYIKTYLLPDRSKHSKRKTDIKKKTLNPIYKETLKYTVEESEFPVHTLWLSVWDWDRFGKNKFLGEMKFPLSEIDFSASSTEQWYPLHDRDDSLQATISKDPAHRGELRLGLMFSPVGETTGTLHIAIRKAKSLPNMDEVGVTDGYVKLYLLPDKTAKGKRKTAIIKNNLNPVWEEKFAYEKLSVKDLKMARVLEVTVWDYDRGSTNDFVGGLRLGPAPHHVKNHKEWIDSNREEASHWEEMLTNPGKWVERWHSLRSSMDSRDIDLSSVSSFIATEEEDDIQDENVSKKLEGVLYTDPGTREMGSLAGAVEDEMDNEFKKVSVHGGPRKQQQNTTSPQDDSLVVSHEPKIVSLRKHPERPVEELKQFSKPPLSLTGNSNISKKEASPPATSHVDETNSCPPTHRLSSSPSPPLKTDRVSPHLLRASTPPSSSPLLQQFKFHGSSGTLNSNASFVSMASMYSAAGPRDRRDVEITGEVLFGVAYVGGQLEVNVSRARSVAATSKHGYSNTYIKTYLLPDSSKGSKKKTSVKKKTVNPVYNETLKYRLAKSELASRTLWLSVWDWDKFGRNQFLGEVRLPLSSMNLTDSTQHWYTLLDKDENTGVDEFVRGEMKVGLLFQPTTSTCVDKGTLNIHIKEARDLPAMNSGGLTNAIVKCFLLPDRSSSSKKKTGVIKNNLNPVWEEKFHYQRVTLRELLEERVLEVTVWDHDKVGNDFIGGLHLGGSPGRSPQHKKWMDCIGTEVTHWEEALSRPGEWVDEWHTLRASMVPREVDLSKSPPPFTMPSLPTEPVKSTAAVADKPRHAHIVEKPTQELSQQVSSLVPEYNPEQHTLPSPGDDAEASLSPTIQNSSTIPAIQLDAGLSGPSSTSSHVTPSGATSETHSTPEHDYSHEFSEEEQIPKSQDVSGVKRSGLLGLSAASGSVTSFGSTTSIYSAAGGKGDYDITGEVLFGVHYKGGQLVVHIDRARDLAAADSNGYSDPYIKTYLLPDRSKNTKKKTDIKKKTLNPVYNHTIKYKVSQSDVASRTLWLSVWDWDRFGRNQFLGEVRLPLSSVDLSSPSDQWYSLQDKDDGEEEGQTYKGELSVSMMFEKATVKKGKVKGTLHVLINKAKDLNNHNSGTQKTDSFVKCYLLPDKSSSGKRKTSVVKNSRSPIWEESFLYEKLNFDELASERVLELAVWDMNKGSSSEFIGGLRLGPAPRSGGKHKEWIDSIGEEVRHWESVMTRPGEWIEVWHTLRTTMDYRNV